MSGKKEIKKKVAEKGVAVLSDALDKLLNNVKTKQRNLTKASLTKQRNKASLQKFEESRSGATPTKPKPKAKVKPKKMATKVSPPSELKKAGRILKEKISETNPVGAAGAGIATGIGLKTLDETQSGRMQSYKDSLKNKNVGGNKKNSFKIVAADVTSDQLKKAGLSLGKAGLTKYLNKAKKLGRRPKASDFVETRQQKLRDKITGSLKLDLGDGTRQQELRDKISGSFRRDADKKSGGGMAKKKVIKKANGGMATKWESKWR